MKRSLFLILVIVLCFILPRNARAGDYQCSDTDISVNLAVVFANGMLTTEPSAVKSRMKLEPYVLSKLGVDDGSITFENAINTDDTLEQFYKVVKQRVSATATEFVKMIYGIIPFPESVVEEINEIAAQSYARSLDDHNLQEQVILYKNLLNRGQKVVVVAHSQGNLYSNAAYDSLFTVPNAPFKDDKNSFRIVSVGTPANRVAGNQAEECDYECYTTLTDDLIMQMVNTFFPDTLNPNLQSVGLATDDVLLSHGFVEAYLKLDVSRNKILDHINWQFFYLDDITWTTLDGTLTATLSWEGNADLDLHVFESDYIGHAYSQYPEGSVGMLDVYDEDADGMEHYYAECRNIQEGLYEFAVGFYQGDAPVTARITIQAGRTMQSFTKVLETEQGTTSYIDPIPIAWLDVKNRGGGKLVFNLSNEDPEDPALYE